MRHSLSRALQQTGPLKLALQSAVKASERTLNIFNYGEELMSYEEGMVRQDYIAAKRSQSGSQDALMQLQHPPLYTYGKRGNDKDLVTSRKELEGMGIPIYETARGGEVTYHGPGQLVVYPIVSLRQLGIGARAYVEGLEDCLIRVADHFGVQAKGRIKCRTGVWVGDKKLAAIGVRISQGITTHGVALNVGTDLDYFKHIVACGVPGARATSLESELQRPVSFRDVSIQFAQEFASHFGYRSFKYISGENDDRG